jgi:signal transduction histidine kinase
MLADCTRRPLQRTLVDISALALDVAADLAQASPERGEVELDIAPGLLARADADLVRIVLVNLLGNARKFTRTRARGAIAVGVVAGSSPPLFFVRDDGVGFDMTYAKQLFSPFGRLHSAAEFEGTGIGLATVQRIIERHGGSLWAESSVDNGATFFFTLPEGPAAS